jgi:hypothetical protein
MNRFTKMPGQTLLKLALLVFLGTLASLLCAGIAGAYWLQANARTKAIVLLEEKFDNVALASLDFQLRPKLNPLPIFSATGEGLSLGLKGREKSPPFLKMRRFTVAFGLTDLLADPIRINRLDLDYMSIEISPNNTGNTKIESGPSLQREIPVFVIEELVSDGAVLRIHSKDPDKEPLQFDLHELRMTSVGPRSPMSFEALLDNATPPGLIQTKGEFGPLTLPDPGASPVSGNYIFEKANLSVFGGIGGTLHSKGEYSGILERIAVEGYTEVPDFHLKQVGTSVSLRTDFSAVVDGTSGDTFLEPVDVQIEDSRFTAIGAVSKKPGRSGKTVELDAKGANARIEDFLKLAVKSQQPLLMGELLFESRILIPSGNMDILEKLYLEGRFEIQSTKFPNPEVQEKVNLLSELGRGDRPKREGPDPQAVVSDIGGDFVLEDGVLKIEDLLFKVPGATVGLLGHYSLLSEEVDFRGELMTDAKVSQMTGGIKSLLLKAVDPLFKRKGAGAVIPIRIEGTRSDISFGVEKGRIFSRKDAVEGN